MPLLAGQFGHIAVLKRISDQLFQLQFTHQAHDHAPVLPGCGRPGGIRAQDHPPDKIAVLDEPPQDLPALQVPQDQDAIRRRGKRTRAIRQENRAAHLEHLRLAGEAVVQAGPFLDDEGEMCGSMIVYAAANRDEVEDWLRQDPYEHAGLFESVTIRPWKRTIG